MNLDRLIAAADPAQGLVIPRPDPESMLCVDRPRRVLRPLVAAAIAVSAVGGSAMVVGAATGAIDLGGGRSAVPVQTAPFPTDPSHPYLYRVDGPVPGRDGSGPIYVESSEPLATSSPGQIDATAIAKARRACGSHAAQQPLADGTTATVWLFDATCFSGQP
jgi:hypothetical protein